MRKRLTYGQSLERGDNHICAREKAREKESSNAEMEGDKRKMVQRIYMAAVRKKCDRQEAYSHRSHTFFCISNADICVFW